MLLAAERDTTVSELAQDHATVLGDLGDLGDVYDAVRLFAATTAYQARAGASREPWQQTQWDPAGRCRGSRQPEPPADPCSDRPRMGRDRGCP
jgi:hypothetical protein